MSRKTANPDYIEVVSTNATSVFELLNNKFARIIGSSVCALAFFSANLAEAHAENTPGAEIYSEQTVFPEHFSSSVTSLDEQPRIFGFVEDDGKRPALSASRDVSQEIASANMPYVKITVPMLPGNFNLGNLGTSYNTLIDHAIRTAEEEKLKVMLVVWQAGLLVNKGAPVRPNQWQSTCDTAVDLIKKNPEIQDIQITNEDNNPQFWPHQFKNGKDAVSTPLVRMAGICYDKLTAINPSIRITLGGLASTGNDDPNSQRPSQSPEQMILNICSAFKKIKRTRPIMTNFGINSYPPQVSEDPGTQHPNSGTITVADSNKAKKDLQCFAGTAQPVPNILWTESGHQTDGNDDNSDGKISESLQADIYYQEGRIAYCNRSAGFLWFLFKDDPGKDGWKSGVERADGTKKRSFYSLKKLAKEIQTNTVDCSTVNKN